VATGTGV